jgi:hypothetical protein
MAQPTDLTGMLTEGLFQPTQQAIPSSFQEAMIRQAQSAGTGLRRGIGAMTGADTRTNQEVATVAMRGLDITDPKDQPKILQIVRKYSPEKEAQVTAAMSQNNKLLALQKEKDKADMKIQYLVDPVTQTTKGNVFQRGSQLFNADMQPIDLEAETVDKGLILSDNYVKPPSPATTIRTGKSPEEIKAELEGEMTLQQFKDQSKDLVARGKITKESYDKFMPVLETLEQLEASGAVGEGGAGAAFFADAANAMTTAMQIIDPNFKAPVGATSKIQYESIAKMLKAKMTEMTKGAISDRENTEHNKYTTSINMPKAVRQSKINIDKATLESAMNKQNAEEQWFEKYRTTAGFNAAWRRYTEDFPRTAGATLRNVTDANGKTTKKLVDNFEIVEDNMRLFDRLYLGKKTSGSPVFTNGEETTSLKQVKESLRQAKLQQLMNSAQVTTPSKIMEEDAKRFVRKNIGTELLNKLDLEGWRVTK